MEIKVDGVFTIVDGKSVATEELLAAIAAAHGEQWIETLAAAHLKLSHALHNQNFPDVGSEPYDRASPQNGKELEQEAGAIAMKLLDVRDERPPKNSNRQIGIMPKKTKTFRIDAELLDKLERRSLTTEQSQIDIVESALKEYLSKEV